MSEDKVEIQCPECKGMIVKSEYLAKGYFCCNECLKIYTEAEIRERCGI